MRKTAPGDATLSSSDTERTPQARRFVHPHAHVRMVGGVKNFLHRDALACAIQTPDMTGAVPPRRDFRAQGDGEGLARVDPLTQPDSKGFIGERAGAETGLQYLHARTYDPKLALFTTGDGWDPTDARVGTNRTMYALGDPVNPSDPNGHHVDKGHDARAPPCRPERRAPPKRSQPSQQAAAGPRDPGSRPSQSVAPLTKAPRDPPHPDHFDPH